MTSTATILGVAFAASCATAVGGWIALRCRGQLPLLLGFSAGTLIAVAFFELLPESLSLGLHVAPHSILALAACGFFAYLVLDRLLSSGFSHFEPPKTDTLLASTATGIGAMSLCIHSLIDGLMLGWSFDASVSVGLAVTVAILTHDLSDGINTVSLVLRRKHSPRHAIYWLGLDAAAPVLGAALSRFIAPSMSTLQVILAVFAGFFLYLGCHHLLPVNGDRRAALISGSTTILGASVMYTVVRLTG